MGTSSSKGEWNDPRQTWPTQTRHDGRVLNIQIRAARWRSRWGRIRQHVSTTLAYTERIRAEVHSGAGFNPSMIQQLAETPGFGFIKQQAEATDQQGFHYSHCTGRRKALLIGINYFGQSGELGGCINDVCWIPLFSHHVLYLLTLGTHCGAGERRRELRDTEMVRYGALTA